MGLGVGVPSTAETGYTPPESALPVEEQLLSRNLERCRGGFVFKAHRPLYHSTLGSGVIKKKARYTPPESALPAGAFGGELMGLGVGVGLWVWDQGLGLRVGFRVQGLCFRV